jgi:alpha-glucosidase (family GH31 glycosyl hydrolase)
MIADFDADGVKTIAVTEPFILTTSKRWQDAVEHEALARAPTGEPRRFDFYFGNTGLVDIFDENAADWFWQPYELKSRRRATRSTTRTATSGRGWFTNGRSKNTPICGH